MIIHAMVGMSEIALHVTDTDIEVLASVLRQTEGVIAGEIDVNDTPWDATLRGVRVVVTAESLTTLTVDWECAELIASGDRNALGIFAEELEGLMGSAPGAHYHLEYNHFVSHFSRTSSPLVVEFV